MSRRLLFIVCLTVISFTSSSIGAESESQNAAEVAASSVTADKVQSSPVSEGSIATVMTTTIHPTSGGSGSEPAQPIKCYQCNSHANNQSTCANIKKDLPNEYLQPCPLNHAGKEATGCWRQMFKIPYSEDGSTKTKTERMVRSCAYSIPHEDKFSVHQSEFGSTSNQYFCNQTACNQSSRIDNAGLMSILFSIMTSATIWMLFN